MTGIDINQFEEHILSIRLSADGFSFSIHHPQKRDDWHYSLYPINTSYSMTANLKNMIAATEVLRKTYKKVNVLIDTPRVTPIPFDMFEDDQLEKLFYYNYSPIRNEAVLCNILEKSNMAILFGIDKHTLQLLNEQFPQARIFTTTSPLIETFIQESRHSNKRLLYAHILKNSMQVFAFERGKLLLTNTFSCKHTSDRVYYLLYIWQQLGFSQENDQLYLIGALNDKQDLIKELQKFLRQIEEITPERKEIPFDMQTLLTCE